LPDPRVAAVIAELGASLRGIRAAQIDDAALTRADIVWVMEETHREEILKQYPGYADKISLLDHGELDVPDPYFGSKADVRRTVEHINESCAEHARQLCASSQ
jgi:protein-tyrosine-phosphatase